MEEGWEKGRGRDATSWDRDATSWGRDATRRGGGGMLQRVVTPIGEGCKNELGQERCNEFERGVYIRVAFPRF